MPRVKTGSVFEIRTNKQGWNRVRAELETEKIVQQIDRGKWVPRGLSRAGVACKRRCASSASRSTSRFALRKQLVGLEAARPR
jgi:hypothetical protein